MKRSFIFSEHKFVSLPLKQQHKKCFELIYELLTKTHDAVLAAEYDKLIGWMGVQDLPITWSDRYHYHVERSEYTIKEDRLLVDTGDKAVGAAFLPLAIYLDRLRSAHNIGSILRTVEAFRLGEVYFSEGMAGPQHPQVIKTAMGCASWVPCHHCERLETLPRPIIAIETCVEAAPVHEYIFPEAFTLVVGNEEEGCSQEVLSVADQVLRIPLYGRKNSLNVANAFAIVAYEVARQKREGIHDKK